MKFKKKQFQNKDKGFKFLKIYYLSFKFRYKTLYLVQNLVAIIYFK